MAVTIETVAYDGPGGPFEAMVALPEGVARAPGVLIAPSFMGRSPFEVDKARALAALGYVGFALDIYGQDGNPANRDQAGQAMATLDRDRPLLQARMAAALDALRAVPGVDPDRLGAIGFCFGGKCVLDLARTGAPLAAVASFHGVYDAPANLPAPRIAARVLVLHGWDDPLCPPDAFAALGHELTRAGTDWQAIAYGGTGHAFTNPAAQQPEQGMAYQPRTDRRAWRALTGFLEEAFAG